MPRCVTVGPQARQGPWQRCGCGHGPYQPGWQMHCPQTKFPWKLHLGESNSCSWKREEALLNGPSCPQDHFRNQKGRSKG